MSSNLSDVIARVIAQHGPMSVGEYMSLCLGHPEHGYYMTRDPFGVDGDFTTAPEISQMFGEMVGVWIADTWMKLGSPKSFALVECGPGRGTLMEDALRAVKGVPDLHQSLRLFLMEISPVLKEAQASQLGQYSPTWISSFEELPDDMPVIVVGNEFLDALPIRQLIREKGAWSERVVALNGDGTFCFGAAMCGQNVLNLVPSKILHEEKDGVFEVSPAINQYIKRLSIVLKKQKGAALFVDYGHAISAMGDTLQAVKSHRFENVLEEPGERDLTAHVDFENVAVQATKSGIFSSPIVSQSDFLKTMGIEMRAVSLKQNATESQAQDIDAALYRLLDEKQMGQLFKVIALCHDERIQLAGF